MIIKWLMSLHWLQITQGLAACATILGIIGLFFAYRTYKQNIEKDRYDRKKYIDDNTLKIASNLMEQFEEWDKQDLAFVNKLKQKEMWYINSSSEDAQTIMSKNIFDYIKKNEYSTLNKINNDEDLYKRIIFELLFELGGMKLFNQLNIMCSLLIKKYIDEDFVFYTFRTAFIRFIRQYPEIIYEQLSIYDFSIYMPILYLYTRWTDKERGTNKHNDLINNINNSNVSETNKKLVGFLKDDIKNDDSIINYRNLLL